MTRTFFFLIVFTAITMLACQPKGTSAATNQDTNNKQALIPYRDGQLWGFARPDSTMVVEPRYEQVYTYPDGYGRIYDKERTGLVAPDGRIILQPQYTAIGEFDQGLAYVYTPSGQYGFIDTTGKVVIATVYDEVYGFYGNRCVAKNEQLFATQQSGRSSKNTRQQPDARFW
ncbi:MAG: WG repeat-containing protein [Saprospiraceae bacterium]